MKILGFDFQIKRDPSSNLVTLPKGVRNQFYDAVYRFLGKDTPVWMSDNPESYIKKGYAYNSDVYSIINYIITTAAQVPWELMQRQPDGTLKAPNEKEERIIRFRNVTRQPNPHQSEAAYREALLGYKLSVGGTYAYKVAADKGQYEGQALQMFVLPAHAVTIMGGSVTDPVGGYQVGFMPDKTIEPSKVMHSKYWNPDADGGNLNLYGLSPIRAAAKLITQSNAAFQANATAFQNGGAKGMISQPAALAASSETSELILTNDQIQQIKRVWDREYGGESNINKVAFTSAALQYTQLGLSPVDMAILGAMKLSFQQLCRIWKFPSPLLNDGENSTYNNMSEAKKMLYTDCIMPELNSLADDMHGWLVAPFGDDLVYRPDFSNIEVLQANYKEQAEWLYMCWGLTPNQRNEIMGFPKSPDPNMDKVYVPTNLTPLDELNSPTDTNISKALADLKAKGITEYKTE